MFEDTQPAALDGDGGPDRLADFRVADPSEVKALLKSVMDRGVAVNLNGSDGSVYTSTLWTVDGEQGKIAFTADLRSTAVQRLVEAEEATAVGYLDQIKLQFDVRHRLLVHGHQTCVLQAALPRELYRFQRRNAYRVRTLERSAPTARFRHPELPDMLLELRVLDVSIGGCALFMPNELPPMQPGIQINQVMIELDGETDFRASMLVHHVTSIQPQSRGVRLGCELRGLDANAQRALQRYIDQTQKRRRMMSLD
jgi:c-di-GMP-binding flagellar brake protein YcgR